MVLEISDLAHVCYLCRVCIIYFLFDIRDSVLVRVTQDIYVIQQDNTMFYD